MDIFLKPSRRWLAAWWDRSLRPQNRRREVLESGHPQVGPRYEEVVRKTVIQRNVWKILNCPQNVRECVLAIPHTWVFSRPYYLVYSQTCIKRPSINQTPFIKRTVVKVPKMYSVKHCKLYLYNISGHRHPTYNPNQWFFIVLTCIEWTAWLS